MFADLITRVAIWFTDPCGYCGMVPDPDRMCDDCWIEMVARGIPGDPSSDIARPALFPAATCAVAAGRVPDAELTLKSG